MVLCPDVFQGNWTAVQNIAELGEKVAKQATELYQQVSMFVCVLSGLMILLCVSFLSYGLYIAFGLTAPLHLLPLWLLRTMCGRCVHFSTEIGSVCSIPSLTQSLHGQLWR